MLVCRTRIVEISGRVAKSGSRDISFGRPEVSLKRNTSGFLNLDYDAAYVEHKNIKCLFLNGTISRLFSASLITYFVKCCLFEKIEVRHTRLLQKATAAFLEMKDFRYQT